MLDFFDFKSVKKEYKVGELVEAEVLAVYDIVAGLSIPGHKNDVPVAAKELAMPAPARASDVVKVGDKIEVVITGVGGENGLVVSKVRAAQQVAWKALENLDKDEPVDAEITQVVKGGLVAMAKGVRAFIPASQIELNYVKNLDVYVGQTVKTLPLDDVNVLERRFVLSRRRYLELFGEQETTSSDIEEEIDNSDISFQDRNICILLNDSDDNRRNRLKISEMALLKRFPKLKELSSSDRLQQILEGTFPEGFQKQMYVRNLTFTSKNGYRVQTRGMIAKRTPGDFVEE